MPVSLITKVRKELASLADPMKASRMQAYMKSTMPYHGVASPLLKKSSRELFAGLTWSNSKAWQRDVLDLWSAAKFREERYCALHLAGHKNAAAFQTPAALPLYEKLIVSGAWWDYVDDIAIHRVGPILENYPDQTAKKMRAWSRSTNIWKRRSSIISQNMIKDKNDLDLLYSCIEPSMLDEEFFLRKGIGWALRELAWRDPDEAIRYVRKNKDRLSPLTKREALKNVMKSGRIGSIP